jgi:hypothetical protein
MLSMGCCRANENRPVTVEMDLPDLPALAAIPAGT